VCLAGACQTAELRPLLEPLGGIDAAAPLE
jgi:hypothetical protein